MVCASASGAGAVNTGTINRLAYYSGTNAISSFNTLAVDSTSNANRLGVNTTTPWGTLSVDQGSLSAETRLKPIFTVASTGTSTPFIFVSQKGVVGFGTSSPTDLLLNPGDVAIGRNGATSDLFVSGGLGVGNATTTDGILETSGLGYIGGQLKVKGTATSTIDNGLLIAGSGLYITNGSIRSDDTSTSTFSGGIYANDFRTNLPSCSQALETDASGAIVCGTDADTTYTAGKNLGLSGTIFTLDDTLYSLSDVFATSTGASVYATSTLQATGNIIGYASILGGGTTTAWGGTAIDQLASQGRLKPIFTVASTGTTVKIGRAACRERV